MRRLVLSLVMEMMLKEMKITRTCQEGSRVCYNVLFRFIWDNNLSCGFLDVGLCL